MAIDSMLCNFRRTYPTERIDSVRYLLEDKERQMLSIVRILDKQQAVNKKIADQVPVIAQKSVQEQPKSRNEKDFWAYLAKRRSEANSNSYYASFAQ